MEKNRPKTLFNSMADDLKAAMEVVGKSRKSSAPEKAGGFVAGDKSEADLVKEMPSPVPVVPAVQHQDVAARPEDINDEYAGNISYEALKNKTVVGSEVSEKKEKENAIPVSPSAVEPEALSEKALQKPQEKKEKAETLIPAAYLKNAAKKNTKRSRRIKIIMIGFFVVLLVGAAAFFFAGNRAKKSEDPANNSITSEEQAEDYVKIAEDFPGIQNANDALRAKNLAIIANTATAYHLIDRADFPVSPTYVRLSESNPVVDFIKDALKRYGKQENLMEDPSNSEFYYAYKSLDGQNVEFTAHMEDAASVVCAEGQKPCLFVITFSEEDAALNANLPPL